MKTLVVYYSRKGYVRRLAEAEAERLSAPLLRLETTERTKGLLGFLWCGRFGMHRWGMPLAPYTCDPSEYDRVLICSPVWVFREAAPVREFLRGNAGRIRAADYLLVHFSAPMRYRETVRRMDETLGLTHGRLTSVRCVWGRIVRREIFE